MIKIEKSSAPRVVIGKHLTSLIEKNNKIIVIITSPIILFVIIMLITNTNL